MNCTCGSKMECIIGDYYQCSRCTNPLHTDILSKVFCKDEVSKPAVQKISASCQFDNPFERFSDGKILIKWPNSFKNKIGADDDVFDRIRDVIVSAAEYNYNKHKVDNFWVTLPGNNAIQLEGNGPSGYKMKDSWSALLEWHGLSYGN